MRLIYEATGEEVKVGDQVHLSDSILTVCHFRPPHKPSASGRVALSVAGKDGSFTQCEYYVSVIGAKWVEREDQDGSI